MSRSIILNTVNLCIIRLANNIEPDKCPTKSEKGPILQPHWPNKLIIHGKDSCRLSRQFYTVKKVKDFEVSLKDQNYQSQSVNQSVIKSVTLSVCQTVMLYDLQYLCFLLLSFFFSNI